MNKQLIQKFLDKACWDEQCQIELDDVVDLEKFAELIVKECLQICMERERQSLYGVREAHDTIKKRFGVEE